jgi:S1-C subfamily serine protease
MRSVSTPAIAAIALGIGLAAGHVITGATDLVRAVEPATVQAATTEEAAVIAAVQRATPAVVSVARPGGTGSGVIVRADGLILTNAHVVGDARQVQIRLADGQTTAGEVLGRHVMMDIAVVRVPLRNLPAAPLGDSDQVVVGQSAIAIGNPFGLERTVTRGIISALDRAPAGTQFAGMIQTDAAINPGNSGGPLIDTQGRVIGINTAAIRPTVGIGLGFAVPINDANDIVQQLLTTGTIVRAIMGVLYEPITPQIASVYRLPVEQGLIVTGVEAALPAARAGMRAGDIITAIDGAAVASHGDAMRILRARSPGQTVRVTVQRQNQRLNLNVQLVGVPAG